MTKKKNVICTNKNVFDEEFQKSCREWLAEVNYDGDEDEVDEYDLEEYMAENNSQCVDDERSNLKSENTGFNGFIVAFVDLGLWDGHHQGTAIYNDIPDILSTSCDYYEWYCDAYNVIGDFDHHDGSNHALYRWVETREKAERIKNKIYNCEMDEAQFKKATKSLRPFVQEVYGF